MAKLSGFSPIITSASPHNEALLKSLGATHVIDRSLSSGLMLAALHDITGDTPLEYVYDAISLKDTQALAYEALAPGGSLALVLPNELPPEQKNAGDGKRIVFSYGTVHAPFNRKVGVEVYSRLTEWLRTGVVVVRLAYSSLKYNMGCAHYQRFTAQPS